jgi:ABC-2 type transport system permease protein
MSVDVAPASASASGVRQRQPTTHPNGAITRRAFGQIWLGAVVWALVFGVSVASTAATYVSTYPTPELRKEAAAAVAGDRGLAMLVGPTDGIDTVGGYTFYKVFVMLTTIGGVWALLAATRLLRGEEDAGRWQLVLAGSTRPARATGATLAALFGAVLVVFAGTGLFTMLVGRDPDIGFGAGPSLLYAVSIAIVPMVFVGVGAFTSQLAGTRRRATGLAMAVFGVALVLRMVADSGPGTRWLLWTTPFGWSERMRPLTDNNPWPLLPAVVTAAVLVAGAVLLSARRDAGSGVIGTNDVAAVRPLGLRSATALAARLELPVLGGWFTGVIVCAAFFGLIAQVTTGNIPDSLSRNLDKFVSQGSFADQFFAIGFVFVATLLALIPASQVSAAYDEECSGRLVHILSRSTTRARWFSGRLSTAAVAIIVTGLGSGVATWLAATSQGVEVDAGSLVTAGVNCIPIALVSLGLGALALAVVPRAATPVVYALVIWSMVVYMFGSLFTAVERLEATSLFHYMNAAPAEAVDITTLTVTTAVAGSLCAIATLLFARRDIRTP